MAATLVWISSLFTDDFPYHRIDTRHLFIFWLFICWMDLCNTLWYIFLWVGLLTYIHLILLLYFTPLLLDISLYFSLLIIYWCMCLCSPSLMVFNTCRFCILHLNISIKLWLFYKYVMWCIDISRSTPRGI